jgi:hypothetical protein
VTFLDRALPLITRGIPVIPLLPRDKVAFLSGWEDAATTDPNQIEQWNSQGMDYNCGAVAKAIPGGFWMFEYDSGDVANRVYADTKKKLPNTFRVKSSEGRGHIYFRSNEKSIEMGNLSQAFVKGGDWSARVHNQYCCGPFSIHPKTGLPYEITSEAEIVEAPVWFIDWLLSQKVEKKKAINEFLTGETKIPEKHRNAALTSIAGGFRNKGLNADEILIVLTRMNEERCDPPLEISEITTIANSIGKYPVGRESLLLVGGRPAGFGLIETSTKHNPIDESADETLRSRVKEILVQTAQTIDTQEPRIVVLNTLANLRQLDYLNPGFPQPLTKKSLWGLMGDFVEIAYPTTVASREMILFQALPALGVVAGKKFYVPFGADRHYGMVWTLNIARTADGKGSVKNIVLSALQELDDYVFKHGVKTNIASGEALARVAMGSGMANTMTKLIWVMPEMTMLFNSMHREGSILSHMLREAYDSNQLENEKSDRKKSYTATNYLLGMMGTTSPLELRQAMPAIDWHNGVANRFLWNVGARTKKLKTSRLVPDFSKWAARFKKVMELNNKFPADQNIVEYSADGLDCWNDWIDSLPEEDEDSHYGLSQGRIKPNCLRAAMFYAQIDEERLEGWPLMIEPRHIEAGIEIVTRSADSTAYYLSGGAGRASIASDSDIKRIYEAIATKARETGQAELTRTEVTRMFRKMTEEQKDRVCLSANLHLETRPSPEQGGCPTDVWCVNKGS